MKIRILLPALFLLPTLLCAQTWETLNAPSAYRYDDVFFLNQQKGWACKDDGRILHTNDNGQSWTIQYDDGDSYLRSIEFLDDSIGFCGGLDSDAWLFRTTNGGQTWTNISDGIPDLPGGICGLSCPGNNTVYGCGRWNEPAYVIKSTDGGMNWEVIDMSAWASKLVDIFFITPDSGWVSGTSKPTSEGGILLSTSDGGQSWHVKAQTSVGSDIIWKMHTPDSLHFFAAIERFNMGSNTEILKSSDSGQNWSIREVDPDYSRLQMIGFLDSLYGFCGSDALFETQDGGASWQEIQQPPGSHFNRFHRLNTNAAIVTGAQLYRLSRTSTSQSEPISPAIPEPCLLRVSPNPSTGLVTISVELKRKTSTWLSLSRLDGAGGQQILWTGEHPAGSYQFSADFRLFGSGTYVVCLKTNFGTLHQLVPVLLDR